MYALKGTLFTELRSYFNRLSPEDLHNFLFTINHQIGTVDVARAMERVYIVENMSQIFSRSAYV